MSSVAAAMRRNFVDTETLDGANKYKCGGCRAYVKAERGSKIHVSPNTLVVPVKRYQLGRAGKITKFVEYPATLDLSPYMSDDAPYEGAPGDDASAPTYDLYGVLVHLDFMGSANSGTTSRSCPRTARGAVRRRERRQHTHGAAEGDLLFYERERARRAAHAHEGATGARGNATGGGGVRGTRGDAEAPPACTVAGNQKSATT